MKVVYTAPNRAHHYRYASSLHQHNKLLAFVNGFSRFSPRAKFELLGDSLHRVDFLQNIYLLSLKLRTPKYLSDELAYLAKIEQDIACKKFMHEADIFLFYNGSGLSSCKNLQNKGGLGIVEAVNTHVQYQENILKEEFDLLKLPWQPFHKKEKERRIKEYDIADYILFPSEFAKRSFINYGFPEEKLLKVPYGFDSISLNNALFEQSMNASQKGKFIVLYVGSISVRKGLRYLIEGFKNLSHPNKKLVIVGPVASITGLEDVSIPDDVVFTGVLKGNELEDAYNKANVFCLPSIEDGFGLVLGEALAHGIPVISSSHTGASEIIEDGVEGFIVEPRDSKKITELLQKLADDDVFLAKMREACFLKAKSLKGWDETGNRLVSTLTDVHQKNLG